ncbi:MAG: MnhB domain-containing protein [Peptostreptococcaceae bacterium]|jgi:multicomponent Na+:H+ antiporter subunit B|nr:MnhB domain-containing protein [Peptostreptococcaceae bacterium]
MNNKVLFEISKIVTPFIQVFGIYVIVNGHLSPGGGFAGGTVLGASFILYRIANGKEKASKKLSYENLMKLSSLSLLGYTLLKGYSFLDGGLHLHLPQIPKGTPGNILSAGSILPLNIFVGIVVAVTIYILFSLFSEGEI